MMQVRIDTRKIDDLRRGLIYAGANYQRSNVILAQSLNRAGARVRTDLTRHLKAWTGIRRRRELADRVRPVIASPGNMQAGARVQGRHLRVTRLDFGAAWRKMWSGGRHAAWARQQTADGSFMMGSGKGASHGGGILFARTSSKRFPIKPLWGPNAAREVHRNQAPVRAILYREAQWFQRESVRRAHVELGKAKSRFGL